MWWVLRGLRAAGLGRAPCRYALAAPDRGIITESRRFIAAASDTAFPASPNFLVQSTGMFHPLPQVLWPEPHRRFNLLLH